MKQKLFITAVLLISAISTFSQTGTSFGLNFGYDSNMYHTKNLSGVVSNEIPDFSIGGNLIYDLGEKSRLRVELRYSNISYTQHYDYPSSNLNNLELSKITANNIGIVPHFDYTLFSLGKLDVLGTAGLRFEIDLGNYVRSYTYAGDLTDYDHTPSSEVHSKAMLGATAGLLFKLNVGDNAAITLSPEYTSFFGQYFDQNQTVLQRFSGNLGFEWRF